MRRIFQQKQHDRAAAKTPAPINITGSNSTSSGGNTPSDSLLAAASRANTISSIASTASTATTTSSVFSTATASTALSSAPSSPTTPTKVSYSNAATSAAATSSGPSTPTATSPTVSTGAASSPAAVTPTATTPATTTPTTPTPVVSSPTAAAEKTAAASQSTSGPSSTPVSPSWAQARDLFRAQIGSHKTKTEQNVTEFLNTVFPIDKAIQACNLMKGTADQAYDGKRGAFAVKVLNILRNVREVGDAFLTGAPETVSLAWAGVSILIKIGTDDLDKCELISGCCETIVSIVLNCRLYEKRYGSTTRPLDHELYEVEQKIIESLPNLLYLILDFSWDAKYHLEKSRFKRSLKEAFTGALKEKIDNLTAEYENVKGLARDAFQEAVMDQLAENATHLTKSLNELRAELFPEVTSIIDKIDSVQATINTHFSHSDTVAKFLDRRSKFNPSDPEIHSRNLMAIFEPIRNEYHAMSQWLFSDDTYKAWEDVADASTNLLCLKGPRGFGKSVKITCVIKRLMKLACPKHDENVTKPELSTQDLRDHHTQDARVLYFYFKKGDDAAQFTLRAMQSLLSQMLEYPAFLQDSDLTEECLRLFGGERGDGEMLKEVINSSELLAVLLEKLANLLGIPVYIVLDALDECEDRVHGNLLGCMKSLCKPRDVDTNHDASNPGTPVSPDPIQGPPTSKRSAKVPIKVLFTVRDNVNIEKLLYDEQAEKDALLDDSDSANSDDGQKNKKTKDDDDEDNNEEIAERELPTYVKIILIDEVTNAKDLRMYLEKRVRPMVLRRVGGKEGKEGKQFKKEMNKIVDVTLAKASGNFAYAGMVVANLQQPTKSTLEAKLKQLPPAMEGMYKRSLESLTADEQSLVVFALKWIVWGVGTMKTQVIVEHFKEIFRPREVEEIGLLPTKSETGKTFLSAGPWLDKKKETGEGEEEKEEEEYDPKTDPEIKDTIYHLRNAGRDFFQFDDVTGMVDVHLSVKEWIQSEAKAYEDSMANIQPPAFVRDAAGNWTMSVPIPVALSQSKQSIASLVDNAEANLSIAIDLLYALNSPLWQKTYSQWDPPEEVDWSKWEAVYGIPLQDPEGYENPQPMEDKTEAQKAQDDKQDGNQTSLLKHSLSETTKRAGSQIQISSEEVKKTSDTSDGSRETPSGKANINDSQRPEAVAEASSAQTRTLVDRGTGANIGKEPSTNMNETFPESVAGDVSTFDGDIRNSDMADEDASFMSAAQAPKVETGFKSEKIRYEVRRLVEHLILVQKHYTPEKQKGKLWQEFHEQLLIFLKRENFEKWGTEYLGGVLDENRPYSKALTPIWLAARYNLVFVLEALVQNRMISIDKLNIQNWRGEVPINTAVRRGHLAVVKFLLEKSVDLDIPDNLGQTPLHAGLLTVAAWYADEDRDIPGIVDSVKYLIEADASVEVALEGVYQGLTPLHTAAQIRQKELFAMILKRTKSKDIGRVDWEGLTALHMLAKANLAVCLQMKSEAKYIFHALLKAGADVNAQTYSSKGVLAMATEGMDAYVMKLCIDNGADVHDDDVDGNTCLHLLIASDYFPWGCDRVAQAKLLVEAGLDFERKNNAGITPLALAIKDQQADMAIYLFNLYRAKYPGSTEWIRQRDPHGRTLMYRCAASAKTYGDADIADFLCKQLTFDEITELSNIPDYDLGYTPMHVAAEHGNVSMVNFLNHYDVDLTIKSFNGKTALDIAVEKLKSSPAPKGNTERKKTRQEEVFALLEETTPSVAVDIQTLLHSAVREKAEYILSGLKKHKKDEFQLDVPDADGWTVYHTALHFGARDFLKDHFPGPDHDSIFKNLPKAKAPTRLSKTRRAKDAICISADGMEAFYEKDKHSQPQLILADHPIPPEVERFYFEMEVVHHDENSTIHDTCIGFQSSRTHNYRKHVGYSNGIGIRGFDGWFLKNQNLRGRPFRSAYGAEGKSRAFGQIPGQVDVVGCGIDTKRGTVFATVNGSYWGIATSIPPSVKWYPAVSCSKHATITINFGQKPFRFEGANEDLKVLGM